MKFLATQVTYFLSQNQTRQNIRALVKYLIFLIVVVLVYTVMFHILMQYVEGREYSWITGFYWTLTVMSTLGFGDITFESDIGRLYSIFVMLSGTILLLIMLPFAFIRFFYAPWLEAQIHSQAPRTIPKDTSGHVIICRYDSIAENLIKRLEHNNIPYFVIEEDSGKAAKFHQDDISVIYGKVDDRETYENLKAKTARLIFANSEDTTNTNITLTVQEIAPKVPIIAVASEEDSVDILELSGATHVLPLKHRLGEYLANRIGTGKKRTKVVGNLIDLSVFEFPVSNTYVAGKRIEETDIRKVSGVNIIGVWKRGLLLPANSKTTLSEFCIPVAIGTKSQINKLENHLNYNNSKNEPVLILGGGKVGRAAAQALKKDPKQKVFLVDKKKSSGKNIKNIVDRFVVGDAAERETILRGGLEESSLVILSTNDDAVNIYLSIYCRRLKPDIRIVCRITHERNLEAIHRAGADFVLSYAPLGSESVMSIIQGRDAVIMGEGVEFFTVKTPNKLVGKTLKQSQIATKTGMIVLAFRIADEIIPNPSSDSVFPVHSRINILGTTEQLEKFKEIFELH